MSGMIETGPTKVIAEQLAGRIRDAHEAASAAARSALGHALEAGRLLTEAKEAVPHGGWADYVAGCGMPTRTASLYMRLHRHRDRLDDRQRVADLSVRQAARLLAEPKAEAVIDADPAGEAPLQAPAWYRPGHRHAGTHPSGACFMVWPHPAGEPWVHAFVMIPHDAASPDSGALLEGPKRGIRVDRLSWLFDHKRGGGLPDMRDPSWEIGEPLPVTPEDTAAEPDYNTWLFSSPEDYRRRGMGIVSATPKEGNAFVRACMAIAKAIPAGERRELFDASREEVETLAALPAARPDADEAPPSWYRPSALIVAAHPAQGPSRAWVEVWPHPRDASRAHVIAHAKVGEAWVHYTAPAGGYLPGELEAVLTRWCDAVGLRWEDRASWLFTHGDMKADEAAALNRYLRAKHGRSRRAFRGKEAQAMQSYLRWPVRKAAKEARA